MTPDDLVWAAFGAVLVLAVAALQRVARRLAPHLLAPAHAPLWGLAAACLAVATGIAAAVHPDLAHLWAAPLEAAERGPTGRFAALAVALAALLALVLLSRIAFAVLRPRRAAHAPVPALFLLFAIGPDGTPLEATRRRLYALFATLALLATLGAPWLPSTLDPSLWAASVAALTGLACAFAPTPHASRPSMATPVADPLSAAPPLWPFQDSILDRARQAASLAVAAPSGAGKTDAALTHAAASMRQGRPVLWLVPTASARAAVLAAADRLFATEPAIDRAADLHVLTPSALEAALNAHALPTQIGLAVLDQLEAWTGAELGRARFLVHRVAPDGAPAFLALGTLGGNAVRQAAELVSASTAELLVHPDAPDILGTPRILAPPPQDAALGRTVARTALRAALSEGPQARARLDRVFSPALVESELRVLREAGVLLEGVTSRVRDHALALVPTAQILGQPEAPDVGPVLRLREARSGRIHTLPRALADLDAYEGAILELSGVRWEVQADDDPQRERPDGSPVSDASVASSATDKRAGPVYTPPYTPTFAPPAYDRRLVPPTADVATPIRTLKLALDGPARRTAHRLRGPAAYEVIAAKVLLHARHTGVRHYALGPSGPTGSTGPTGVAIARVHSAELRAPRLAVPFPTEARFIALPSADPVALHTLVHAARDVLPTLFQGASEDLGVTFALPAEHGLGPAGALVLWDRHPEGLGAVADLRDDDVARLLERLRAKLADCDCQSSCARCVERPSCTLTPHNVGLDRRRALAVLDALLIPAHPPALLREPLRKTG